MAAQCGNQTGPPRKRPPSLRLLEPAIQAFAPAQRCVRGFFIPARRLAPPLPSHRAQALGRTPWQQHYGQGIYFRPPPLYTNPPILKIWQHDDENVPPTCYDARNPAMPWLPADELTYEDGEDRAIARDWVCAGGPAESIGALQKRTKQPMATSTAIVPPTPEIFQLTSLQQLAHPATSRKK